MLQLLKHTNRKISLILVAIFFCFRAVYIVQKPDLALLVFACFIIHVCSAALLRGFLVSAQLTLRTSAVSAIAFMAFSSLSPYFYSVYESLGLLVICFVLHILAKSIEQEQLKTRCFQAALTLGFIFPVASLSLKIASLLLLFCYLVILNLKQFKQLMIVLCGFLTGNIITYTALSMYSFFDSLGLEINTLHSGREQLFSVELYVLLFFMLFTLASYKVLLLKKSIVSKRHLLFILIFNLIYALLWISLDFSFAESLYGLIFPVSICSIYLESTAKPWKINSLLYGGLAALLAAQILSLFDLQYLT
ncbi:MAG: DUF6427 family protein [Flavobacteriales bacterium]